MGEAREITLSEVDVTNAIAEYVLRYKVAPGKWRVGVVPRGPYQVTVVFEADAPATLVVQNENGM